MVVSNSAAALTFIALILILSLLSRRVLGAASLPATAHNLLWVAVVGLVGTDLIAYRESTVEAWVTLLVGVVFFNIGAWIGASAGRDERGLDPVTAADDGQPDIALVGRGGLLLLVCLYALGFVEYLRVVIGRFGVRTLLEAPEEIRGAQGESYMQMVPIWARLLLYVGPVLLAILLVPGAIRGRLRWTVRLFLLLPLVVSLLLMLQRTNLLIGLGLTVAVLLSRRPQSAAARPPSSRSSPPRAGTALARGARLRTAALLLVAGLVGLGAFQLVGNALGKTGAGTAQSGAVAPALANTGLTSPFIYLTSATPAFLALTESRNDMWPPPGQGRIVYGDYNSQTWGVAVFEPIASLIPGVRAWNPIAPFVNIGVTTNVYTWWEPLYRDFREIGVALGGFILGLVITYLYVTRWRTARRYWLSSIALSTIMFAAAVPKYNSTPYLFAAVLILGVSCFSTRRAPLRSGRRGHRRLIAGVP